MKLAAREAVAENVTAPLSANITSQGGTPSADETTPGAPTASPTLLSGTNSPEPNKVVSRRWIEALNERDNATEAEVLGND